MLDREFTYKHFRLVSKRLAWRRYRVLGYRKGDELPVLSTIRTDRRQAESAGKYLVDQVIYDERLTLFDVVTEIECTRDR